MNVSGQAKSQNQNENYDLKIEITCGMGVLADNLKASLGKKGVGLKVPISPQFRVHGLFVLMYK